MAYIGSRAADGSLNVTVVTGLAYVGLYAADGSINVTGATVGGPYVGAVHKSGALNVQNIAPNTFLPNRMKEGGMWVQASPYNSSGATRVTFVSGSL